MLGIWFSEINKKIRVRNKGHEVLLVVTDSNGRVLEDLSTTDPERIRMFDVFKGYLLGLGKVEEGKSQEKYDEIISNFKLTFGL